MIRKYIEEFLNTKLDKLKVIEVTDGEVTLEFSSEEGFKFLTLYLNHKLNEEQGLPKDFKLVK